MGFADVGSSSSRVAVRAGRQELVYGDQRLVGHLGWTNAARVFDGVKVTVRGKAASLDVFGASVVRTIEDEFDKSGAGNRFAGAYLTMPKLVKSGSLEPYLFWRRDTNLPGELGVVGDPEGEHGRCAVRRQAPAGARLQRRDGGAAGIAREQRRGGVGWALAATRVVEPGPAR